MFKKGFLIVSFCCFLYGCNSVKKQSTAIQLKFLDEFVLSNSLLVDATLVGGLSGIDYHQDRYYLACDDAKNPRFYEANITIKDAEIDTITITNVIELAASEKALDLESIVVDELTNEILLTSEGSIKNEKDPSFFSIDKRGTFIKEYKIPSYFKAKGKQRPRHNGVFEGLTASFDGKGYWIATELPLKEDGPKPIFRETTSPVRFTYFDTNGNPMNQFAYLLDRVGKKPLGDFAVNGVTDILAYAPTKLLVIERSYSTGYGNQGNVIKLYSVDFTNSENTINYKRLTKANYYPVKKELVFNFETIRAQLTNKSIDNIEGISFGPMLPNGNQSIILVSDNNFNKEEQLNQFILMEVID